MSTYSTSDYNATCRENVCKPIFPITINAVLQYNDKYNMVGLDIRNLRN